jgi:hypothetical protein
MPLSAGDYKFVAWICRKRRGSSHDVCLQSDGRTQCSVCILILAFIRGSSLCGLNGVFFSLLARSANDTFRFGVTNRPIFAFG